MCNSVDIFKILLDKVDKSVFASIQEYVQDKKEFLCYLEDESSDVVSFDTEDDDSSVKIDKSELLDISSVKMDKSGMDVSFFTADEASMTSEYLVMDYPSQKEEGEIQTDLDLLKKIEYLEGQITQEQNLRQDLIQEKNDLVKKVEGIQDFMTTVTCELKEMDTASEIKDLNQELVKVSRRNAELETQIIQVLNEKNDFTVLQTAVKELEAQLTELKNINSELEATCEQKQDKITNLLSEKENNQMVITRLNRDFEKAKDIKNEEDSIAIINLQNLLDQSLSEKDDLQNVVSNLKIEIKDLHAIKEQISEKLMHESAQTESYRNELERLLVSNEQRARENDNLRCEIHKVIETTTAGDPIELQGMLHQ
jgi:chromosome segregation ATPase